MDFMQLAKERHSVRKYAPFEVEEEKILNILEAGRVAPTAANKQPQRFRNFPKPVICMERHWLFLSVQ